MARSRISDFSINPDLTRAGWWRDHHALEWLCTTDVCPDKAVFDSYFEEMGLNSNEDPAIQTFITYIKSSEKSLFVTSKGTMAVVPQSSEPGDEIWFFKGAKVPFVLRQNSGGRCTFLGAAYVSGLMHGEICSTLPAELITDIIIE